MKNINTLVSCIRGLGQAALLALLLVEGVSAADYVWPLSNSSTPDVMNTSFGPRMNYSHWDFHNGIDLPAPIGTSVYAMRGGTILYAGPGGSDKCDGYSSRHVVLRVNDPKDGVMYLVYLHLDSIDTESILGPGQTIDPNADCASWSVLNNKEVEQGKRLGTVGMDDAEYPHLHMEFRKGEQYEINSVHPLRYLPYTNTANFTAPVSDRFNRLDGRMAARLRFGAPSKEEGDLLRVEVDVKRGDQLLETRVVDFNDGTTIIKDEKRGDQYLYVRNIGVEGYQTSNMVADGRTDLHYGILVRNLPSFCKLVARVIDVRGKMATSKEIVVPQQIATNQDIDFEDGAMPPPGWTRETSGSSTTVVNDPSAAYLGSRGMRSIDASTTAAGQRAGIQYTLPAGRFEWIAEGWFNPTTLGLAPYENLYTLFFLNSSSLLSVAAHIHNRVHNRADVLVARIIYRKPDNSYGFSNGNETLRMGQWRQWKLHLLRLGTRETTAVLYVDGEEKDRGSWDSTSNEPQMLRAGIGFTPSVGTTATVNTDDLLLTEVTELVP